MTKHTVCRGQMWGQELCISMCSVRKGGKKQTLLFYVE